MSFWEKQNPYFTAFFLIINEKRNIKFVYRQLARLIYVPSKKISNQHKFEKKLFRFEYRLVNSVF